jgi:alpha-beta hydrolase superfamily lysophospholipase
VSARPDLATAAVAPERAAPGTGDKVEAVVANWYPRFLANGIDFFDLRRMLDAIGSWDDWADVWTADADRYEGLGRAALATGHRVTAAEHLRRAALTLQFGQFVLTDDPPRRLALQQRMSALYAEAAPLLDPPAERVGVAYDGGTVHGYLRVPPGAAAGLVVLLPGLESTKEQFSTYEPFFLRRGVATLSVEGPGQGEGSRSAVFRDVLYGTAMAAVAAALTDGRPPFDRVDAGRVVVLGTSFGGYLALRHAGAFAGLRGVVDIAGPHDLAAFGDLQQVTREGFREFAGAGDDDAAAELLADVDLTGHLERLTAPVLVVHGERDRIVDVRHAHRILAVLGHRATALLEPDGNHSCNNLATTVRPAVADWVSDRLGGST